MSCLNHFMRLRRSARASEGTTATCSIRRLRIDDATGAIALIARHAAQFCEHTFGIGLDRLMGAVAAAPTFVVGAVTGALVVSIMGAPLSITELAT